MTFASIDNYVKVILLTFVIAFFMYETFCSDVFPFTHIEGAYYHPFCQSLPFYLMLFIIGFIILPKGKEEIKFAKEEVKKPEKVDLNDDYNFSDVEEEEI